MLLFVIILLEMISLPAYLVLFHGCSEDIVVCAYTLFVIVLMAVVMTKSVFL